MSGLSELVQRLERLGSDELKKRIGERVAETAQKLTRAGFDQECDPYGIPWARRKDPRGSWPILDKTGAAKGSITAIPVGEFTRLSVRGYMKFAQYGTVKMIARRIFPVESRGLGTWKEPVEQAVMSVVREVMSGG